MTAHGACMQVIILDLALRTATSHLFDRVITCLHPSFPADEVSVTIARLYNTLYHTQQYLQSHKLHINNIFIQSIPLIVKCQSGVSATRNRNRWVSLEQQPVSSTIYGVKLIQNAFFCHRDLRAFP
ncbi:putative glucose transporter rco-3 [Fusarium oxysporum f. sp. albedinis]|nr:putative glucose transporter rco-3 [Fusarium oxysporum f. sp. albedinis]